MGGPAIFLDRDGVVNENRPDHVKCWDEFRFLPGALDALCALTELGAPIFIVTNQAVVGRRLVTTACVEEIHRRMLDQIGRAGAAVAEVLYCPHAPEVGCDCRKPEPGMLLAAAARHDLDLARAIIVGDALTDILAGQRAGCRTVLVLSGRGREALRELAEGHGALPTALAHDLAGAVPLVTTLLQPGGVTRHDSLGRELALSSAAD